jgi:hypothetical protein
LAVNYNDGRLIRRLTGFRQTFKLSSSRSLKGEYTMSNLWIYFRRPSSVVRYRHGGDTAIYPILKQPIVGTQEAVQAAVTAGAADVPVVQEDNVLDFACGKRRAERSRPPRSPPTGVKPKRR